MTQAPRPIFLIGHMACGKTTLGQAVALRTGIDFIDLDAEIESAAGEPVSALFKRQGEAAFRELESRTLARIIERLHGKAAIVACGGGTPCRQANLDAMLAAGTVVWLKASREITVARIALAPSERPRLDGLCDEALHRFLDLEAEQRDPVYSRAHSCFDSSTLDTAEEIDTTVSRFINEYMK